MKRVLVSLIVPLLGAVDIFQSDFDEGTYVIDEPGVYTLQEDIVFLPNFGSGEVPANPEFFLFPTDEQRQGKYSTRGYSLGFFAAIAMNSDDVELDLNGHTISQSNLHTTTQRFFAVIEIANAPFPLSTDGPANLTNSEEFRPARNIIIKNGIIGNSAHHGIHGNSCEDVVLANLTIQEFEVAGISLNNAKNVVMENIVIQDSKRDVRWSGRLSQAIFALRTFTTKIEPFVGNSAALEYVKETQKALTEEVEKAIQLEFDVLDGGDVASLLEELNPIFRTLTDGLPDGSLLAGIILHPNVQTGQFSRNVEAVPRSAGFVLRNIEIRRLTSRPLEQTAMMDMRGNKRVTDMIGASFDFDTVRNLDGDLEYVGTPLSRFQVALTKLRLELESTNSVPSAEIERLFSRDGLSPQILDWVTGDDTFLDLLSSGIFSVAPNRDYQFHRTKGVIGLKIDQTVAVTLENVVISKMENVATNADRGYLFRNLALANSIDSSFDMSRTNIVIEDYEGVDARGVSLSANADVTGDVQVDGIHSDQYRKFDPVAFLNENRDVALSVEDATSCAVENVGCRVRQGLLPSFPAAIEYVRRDEFNTASVVGGEGGADGEEGGNDASTALIGVLVLGSIAIVAIGVAIVYGKKDQGKAKNIMNDELVPATL